MAKKKIKDIVEEELAEFLVQNNYELYNVEFAKEGRDWFLRVFIDKIWTLEDSAKEALEQETESLEEEALEIKNSKYISTDDCEKVSRFLSEKLDALDPIEQNYYLEVSSPGMDRTLLREKDYEKYSGNQVEVALYKPINGSKNLSGRLIGLIAQNLVIVNEKEEEIKLPIEQVAKTKLAVVF